MSFKGKLKHFKNWPFLLNFVAFPPAGIAQVRGQEDLYNTSESELEEQLIKWEDVLKHKKFKNLNPVIAWCH